MAYFFSFHVLQTDNKRLDEWVPIERMDLAKLEQPKKDIKTPIKKEGGVGASRISNGGTESRPSSPEREIVSFFFSFGPFWF